MISSWDFLGIFRLKNFTEVFFEGIFEYELAPPFWIEWKFN